MKVLQVINCIERGGGAEKFVLDLSLALKQKGVNVEVLSIIHPSHDNFDFIEILQRAFIPVHILSAYGLRSVRNIYLLNKFFSNRSYDIIHVHLFPALYFCAICKLKRMNLFYTEHSTDNRRRHIVVFKILDKIIYSQYDKIICISLKVSETLTKHIGCKNFDVIPNGIFVSDFLSAKKLSYEELIGRKRNDEKLILMSARMVKGKDYMTVFRALKLLSPNIHLLCLGTGILENEYRKYCQEESLLERVHFLGLRKDVNRILKTVDVIVLSSEHEGFSLSMLEAMSCGNPFVASDVSGISDLIKGYAVLFPLGNEFILAKCIEQLLLDNVYREEVIKKCQRFAFQYDMLTIADLYIQSYLEVVYR